MRGCKEKIAQNQEVDESKPVEVNSELWVFVGNYPVETERYDECQRQEAGKAVYEDMNWFITRVVIIKESQDADMTTMQVVYYKSPRPDS